MVGSPTAACAASAIGCRLRLSVAWSVTCSATMSACSASTAVCTLYSRSLAVGGTHETRFRFRMLPQLLQRAGHRPRIDDHFLLRIRGFQFLQVTFHRLALAYAAHAADRPE